MECRNNFCIYQKDDICKLDTIELDENGICRSCICVDIPPQILDLEKEKLLRIYETEDNMC